MIFMQTRLKVIDNTGAKRAQCIKILKGKTGSIGNKIMVSIKKVKYNSVSKIKIEKGSLFKALIVQTKASTTNTIGNYICFGQNSVILLNEKEQPIGSRIFGPITLTLRKEKKLKILSLASSFL